YKVDGVDNATLDLNMGSTYLFNVNSIGHPFDIKTQRITGTGSRWIEGVTGNGVQQGTLTFVVPMDAPGTLFYQCEVHSAMGGTLNILGPLDAGDGIPPLISLSQAMPNPARNGSSFRVGLPRNARVDVAMFDSQGRRIRTLWNGDMTAGTHTIKWDGRDEGQRIAASGSYFYRLRVEGHQLTGRLSVTR